MVEKRLTIDPRIAQGPERPSPQKSSSSWVQLLSGSHTQLFNPKSEVWKALPWFWVKCRPPFSWFWL